jgi:hypothetical protein
MFNVIKSELFDPLIVVVGTEKGILFARAKVCILILVTVT